MKLLEYISYRKYTLILKNMENKNLLIDTHAHVNFNDFKDDYKETIKRALDENIWMINVGAEKKTSERTIKMAEEYNEGVYAAVGLHPSHLIEQDVEYKENGEIVKYKSKPEEFDYDFYLNLAKNKKVVGIGECGLDHYHNPENKNLNLKNKNWKEKQKEVFIKHLELAKEVKKPIIIHCRDAHDDLLKILNLAVKPPSGVMHFFTGNLEQAKEYIELGFYISFSGVITFPPQKGEIVGAYDEIIKNVPLEKILIETDCPYVAPVPHRGKRNEPQYVKYVAQRIAEIKGVSFEEVAEQTTKNARKLFKI